MTWILFVVLLLGSIAEAQAPGQANAQPGVESGPSSSASRGDVVSINFISYDSKGDQALELRTGILPLKIGRFMLINTLSYRYTNLSSDNVPPGEDLKLSDYGFGTMIVTPINDWTLMARVGVNIANADSGLRVQRESAFYNSVLVAARKFQSNPHWKYNLGIVVLGKGSRIPAVPVFGFEYESDGQVYQAQIAFPIAQVSYGVSSNFRVGLFSGFTSSSYLLREKSALRADGDYIGVDRIVLGSLIRARLTNLLWLNARLGYSVYGKTAVLGSNLKERRELDEESGLYFLMGFGVSIPR